MARRTEQACHCMNNCVKSSRRSPDRSADETSDRDCTRVVRQDCVKCDHCHQSRTISKQTTSACPSWTQKAAGLISKFSEIHNSPRVPKGRYISNPGGPAIDNKYSEEQQQKRPDIAGAPTRGSKHKHQPPHTCVEQRVHEYKRVYKERSDVNGRIRI